MPKNDQIWPEIGIFVHFGPGLTSSFGALLVGWLVVVARGPYLARPIYNMAFYIFQRLQVSKKYIICIVDEIQLAKCEIGIVFLNCLFEL